jgi:dienelactone hydrolase
VTELEGWCRETIDLGAGPRALYVRGAGPAVLVIHEIPGITPPVERYARRVADAGFTVFMPQLFGTPMRPLSAGSIASAFAEVCIARTFHLFSRGSVGPILDEMRELCRIAHERAGGPGVGVLGMCLTGNFALGLALEPAVRAPVLAQPSLPFRAPGLEAALAVPEGHLAAVKERLTAEDRRLLALRFTHDFSCPAARFQALRDGLGDRVELIELDSSPGNRWGHPRHAHSPLTNELIDHEGQPTRAALERTLAFFAECLKPEPHPAR